MVWGKLTVDNKRTYCVIVEMRTSLPTANNTNGDNWQLKTRQRKRRMSNGSGSNERDSQSNHHVLGVACDLATKKRQL